MPKKTIWFNTKQYNLTHQFLLDIHVDYNPCANNSQCVDLDWDYRWDVCIKMPKKTNSLGILDFGKAFDITNLHLRGYHT